MNPTPDELRAYDAYRSRVDPLAAEDGPAESFESWLAIRRHNAELDTEAGISALAATIAYRERGAPAWTGGECPECASGSIEGRYWDLDGETVSQRVTCLECGSAWVAMYRFDADASLATVEGGDRGI